jgi:hypothetical protein
MTYDNKGSFGELALLYNMPRAATVQVGPCNGAGAVQVGPRHWAATVLVGPRNGEGHSPGRA